MSVTAGQKISLGSVVVALDAANPKSVLGQNSIIRWDSWVPGTTGSATGYGQNGDGNSRLIDVDPFGNSTVVWDVSNQDATSDADGGWDSNQFNIDSNKLYRFSTWVRRKTIGNGSFYLGLYGYNSSGSNIGVLRRDNGSTTTNPYFRSSGWWGNANQWYLVVGHVWPAGSGTGSVHPDTGIYDTSGNKIATPIDFVWQHTNVRSLHRSYLYYSTDTSTNQQWFQPRVDIVDGLQPSIHDLLTNVGSKWINTVNNRSVIATNRLPQYTTLNGVECFNFTSVGEYFVNNSFFSSLIPSDRTNLTIEAWIYPAVTEIIAGDRGNICRAENGAAWYMSWNKSNQKLSNYWYGKTNEGYHESGAAMTRGTWNHVVSVWTSSQLLQFTNGIKTTASTSGTTASQTGGLQIGWEGDTRQFAGGIASIKIYNRALSDLEVAENFKVTRTKFGV